MVEQRIPNPWVVGSNPSRPAKKPEEAARKWKTKDKNG